MAEILLDPNIRFWVFLPIVVITFLVGVIRHYATILLQSDKVVGDQQLQMRYDYEYEMDLGLVFCLWG